METFLLKTVEEVLHMQGSSSSSRWTADDRIRKVMESLTTNITLAELCRKYNLKPNVFYGWKQKFIEGGKANGIDWFRREYLQAITGRK